jgi:catechol 2,3-dioxygenase-like lactoylglutathione lyase family enzyme
MIERLDHINVRTARLDEMIAWYGEVLGMEPGPRPGFSFPGAWLYAKGQPLVHLVAEETAPTDPGKDLKLEHGAFSATGYSGFIEKLEARGERYRVGRIEDFGIVQVNVWDPDGNHLHIDFAMHETE